MSTIFKELKTRGTVNVEVPKIISNAFGGSTEYTKLVTLSSVRKSKKSLRDTNLLIRRYAQVTLTSTSETSYAMGYALKLGETPYRILITDDVKVTIVETRNSFTGLYLNYNNITRTITTLEDFKFKTLPEALKTLCIYLGYVEASTFLVKSEEQVEESLEDLFSRLLYVSLRSYNSSCINSFKGYLSEENFSNLLDMYDFSEFPFESYINGVLSGNNYSSKLGDNSQILESYRSLLKGDFKYLDGDKEDAKYIISTLDVYLSNGNSRFMVFLIGNYLAYMFSVEGKLIVISQSFSYDSDRAKYDLSTYLVKEYDNFDDSTLHSSIIPELIKYVFVASTLSKSYDDDPVAQTSISSVINYPEVISYYFIGLLSKAK